MVLHYLKFNYLFFSINYILQCQTDIIIATLFIMISINFNIYYYLNFVSFNITTLVDFIDIYLKLNLIVNIMRSVVVVTTTNIINMNQIIFKLVIPIKKYFKFSAIILMIN